MAYLPQPLDTSTVELPDELEPLIERLAEHAHDVWATKRLKDGWTFGDERDDRLREHPCLVPYDRLPDVEKDYDRELAIQTLRAVVLLGYRIERAP